MDQDTKDLTILFGAVILYQRVKEVTADNAFEKGLEARELAESFIAGFTQGDKE